MTARSRIYRDRRASTAIEFALTFPVVLLFVFGLIAAFALICSKRAMEVGVEKGLRYAAVNSAAGTTAAATKCTQAATAFWRDVGRGTCAVTVNTSVTPNIVSITYTYGWAAPAILKPPDANVIFNSVTLTANGKMAVMN